MKRNILFLIFTTLLLTLSLPLTSVNSQLLPTAQWLHNDAATKGNWVGTYGSYAYIIPTAGDNPWSEIPIGSFDTPPSDYVLNSPPYYWYDNPYWCLPLAKYDPPYNDEFWSQKPFVQYHAKGTKLSVQEPLFEWEWTRWETTRTDLREVYYPKKGMWKLACWDDGGERGLPVHGYMDFFLKLPKGTFDVTLYAYDYEMYSRSSQEYRIYDGNNGKGALLASMSISGVEFDNGIHVTFRITNPDNNHYFTIRVYNDAGHPPEFTWDWWAKGMVWPSDKTLNVVLSGIFVDKL